GNWVEFYKADYEYNGSVLQKIYTYEREFDEWEPSEITSYQYQGGLVDLIYSLEYNAGTNDWDTTGTVGVEYAGGKVSKAIYMTHDMGAWIHDMDVNYQYDSHGNVISWNEIYQPDGDSWKIDFTYEAGAGNFRQLFAHKGYGEWGFWQPFPTKKSTHSSPFYRLDSETHRILIDYP
ncbi:MAG: hypothetical protein U9R60_00890, partial [Bacteroidota bacterium]|nr:hypothetical protein [Bacteroidota bacterium]